MVPQTIRQMGNTSINENKTVQYELSANGKDLTNQYTVVAARIYKACNMIGKATITIETDRTDDPALEKSDNASFNPGNDIILKVGRDTKMTTLFEGMIITHRLRIGGNQPDRLILECRDNAFPSTLGRKNNLFEKAKDGDVIKKILGQYGLSATVDSTNAEYPQLMQYYCTDWDFVLSRAQHNGLVIITEGKKVKVAEPDVSSSPVLTLTPSSELIEFDGSLSASDQYANTEAYAWEVSTQKVVKASATKPKLNEQGDIAPNKLSGGDLMLYQTNASVGENDLKKWADAQALWSGLARFQGTVKFYGNESVLPGTIIELKDISAHYNGKAYIQAVEHTLDGTEWITCAHMGFNPALITEQADVMAPAAGGVLPGISGIQIGKIKKIAKDKDSEQFVQVEMPLLNSDKKEIWARPASLYAGNETGCLFLPEVNDEVVLGFINNDPCHPVILGSLFSRKQKPPVPIDEKNLIKTIVTKNKLKITFDDEKKIITVETPGNNKIVLDDDAKQILLSDGNRNKVCMDKNGITLESGKDFTIKAQGNIKLDGMGIETQSKQDTKINGLNVEVSAKVGAKVKGSATAEISASGQTVVKGGIVMIN